MKLKKATGIPLVLHGGSGIRRDHILEVIKRGLTKLNIGTDIRHAYERTLNATGSVTAAQDAVSQKMEYLIVEYYEVANTKNLLDMDPSTPQ